MPSDGESSEDGCVSFITTKVLLGYASQEPTDDEISHLGGQPVWIDSSFPLSTDAAFCKVCNSCMSLILQLHANLPEHFPTHERRLFVFSCRRTTCQRKDGSVRAFRSVKTLSSEALSLPLGSHRGASSTYDNLGDVIFGVQSIIQGNHSANPFAMDQGSLKIEASPSAKEISGFKNEPQPVSGKAEPLPILVDDKPEDFFQAQCLKVSESDALRSELDDAPQQNRASSKPFPIYYLEADVETLDNSPAVSTSFNIMDLESSLPFSNSQLTKDDPAAFESALDKTFQRFADRLDQNPLQVLRYDFRGSPLLYSDKDEVGRHLSGTSALQYWSVAGNGHTRARQSLNIPACRNCGSKRVFELQLTPHAISLLEADETGLDGMEWGTVIVGVCENDCNEQNSNPTVGYVEEWVGVQWEET